MNETIVIGLMGPAGSGKSSVADYMVEKHGARRYSFAAPLKELVRRAFDLTHEQVWGTQEQKETIDPRYNRTPRWLLQQIGTEGCRAVLGDDIWIKTCLRQIVSDAPALAVIEDVRFKNEARAISEWTDVAAIDGYVWRLLPPTGRATTEISSTHASETQWRDAPADYELAPIDRGLSLLFTLVDDVCRQMRLFPVRPQISM